MLVGAEIDRRRRLLAVVAGVLALHVLVLGGLRLGTAWRTPAPTSPPTVAITVAEVPRERQEPPALATPVQAEPANRPLPVPAPRSAPRRASVPQPMPAPAPSATVAANAAAPRAPSEPVATATAAEAPSPSATAASPPRDGGATTGSDARSGAAATTGAPAAPSRLVLNATVACANYRSVMNDLAYPREALRLRLPRGEAQVQFILTPNGEVRDVQAVSATHPAFARSAVQAVSALRCAAQGQEVRVTVPFAFNLRDTLD
jgi:protein TonB